MKSMVDDIVANGDQSIPPGWGKKTENLLRDVLEDSGDYVHYDGSYNGPVEGVNGFDGVFIKGNLNNPQEIQEIIINESKQYTGSGISLNGPGGNGRPAQMTNEWINFVRGNLVSAGKADLADAIGIAQQNGTLRKIVTAVDRTGGEFNGGIVIVKVN